MTPRPVLIDTDVLIDFLRGLDKAGNLIRAHQAQIILSAISVAELYAGVKGDKELATLNAFVDLFRVVPVSTEIARLAGLHKRDFHKSHGIGLADAIMAATTKAENAEFKTLNIKHYPMLKGLSPAYSK
ncbi:MAG: type II toxin-antitoxin system VapC family toxin [bacterium]